MSIFARYEYTSFNHHVKSLRKFTRLYNTWSVLLVRPINLIFIIPIVDIILVKSEFWAWYDIPHKWLFTIFENTFKHYIVLFEQVINHLLSESWLKLIIKVIPLYRHYIKNLLLCVEFSYTLESWWLKNTIFDYPVKLNNPFVVLFFLNSLEISLTYLLQKCLNRPNHVSKETYSNHFYKHHE